MNPLKQKEKLLAVEVQFVETGDVLGYTRGLTQDEEDFLFRGCYPYSTLWVTIDVSLDGVESVTFCDVENAVVFAKTGGIPGLARKFLPTIRADLAERGIAVSWEGGESNEASDPA